MGLTRAKEGLLLDVREGVGERCDEVGERFGGVVAEELGRAAHAPHHGRRVGGVDEDVLALREVPLLGVRVLLAEHVAYLALHLLVGGLLHEGQLVGLEAKQLNHHDGRQLGHARQPETLYPGVQLVVVNAVDRAVQPSEDDSGASEQSRRSSYGSGSRFENTLFGDGRRFQNSNPVASQFRADPKPREAVHREEPPRDPFSPSFKRTLAASGGNLRRISSVVNHTPASASRPSAAPSGLQEGQTIEHERFGIGTVVKLEGTGENQKATVQFRNSGTKQLLLKFARFKVIS